ncbi:MAG: folate family ECF transporter S component [Ruminococcus sp.]|mgnify:CR=1 FL=1|nr:folate family ECF transporter S component [Ruminococcus sp.]
MTANNRKNSSAATNIRLFGSIRIMVIAALFVAMSIVLGKMLAINIGTSIRISFENLPILMAGIFFGPLVGAAVGIGADVIGCLIVGYSINPVITLGAASIGLFSGLVSMYLSNRYSFRSTLCAVMSGHIIGSILIKSIGIFLYFHTPFQTLLFRVPLYAGIGLLETYIITLLLKDKAFSAQLERMCGK